MKKRLFASILSTAMLLGVLSGCGSTSSSSNPAAPSGTTGGSAVSTPTAEGTKPGEGLELTVYACVLEDYMTVALDQFSKETGVKAAGVRLGVGETLARLTTESQNPQADIWFGGAAENFIAADELGLLDHYVSPSAAAIPEQYKDKDGAWTGFYIGYLGFAYNAKLLEAAGLQPPTSWDDLLDERYKDQISIASPASSGTSYNLLATLAQELGEDEAIQYMTDLDKNVRNYEKSGTAPARLVGQGEIMVGVTFLHDALKYKEEGFADIEVSTPASGTGYELGCIAVVANGPNNEAAKMFVDWMLEAEHLEIGQSVGSYQFLTHPDAKSPAIADSIKDAKLIDFDYAYAGEKREDLVGRWATAVGQ